MYYSELCLSSSRACPPGDDDFKYSSPPRSMGTGPQNHDTPDLFGRPFRPLVFDEMRPD